MSREEVEAEALRRITPSAAEEEAVAQAVARIERTATRALEEAGVPGRAAVQGSAAKGTWLAGGGDLDLFLLLDPSVPEDRLERIALDVGPRFLDGCHKRYAQHPYLVGSFEGRTVDLVPAYAVAHPGERMSAVDRTPFHTAWVRQRLDAGGRAQVRLLKRWLKGTGAYGAQTDVGGFSGYLAEVLVARFGSFGGVLAWLAADAQPRRIALGPDAVQDEQAPLVVVDPVDPARNCAAAVQAPTLELAAEAARAYLAAPSLAFFFPAPPRAEPAQALRGRLRADGRHWVGLRLRPRTQRLDIVFPQFQKATRSVQAALAQAGFPSARAEAQQLDDGREVLLQWLVEAVELPETRLHRGPPDNGGPNAERFRGKWQGHPDARGPVTVGADGRLEVLLGQRDRTAAGHLRARLQALPLGRHVADALPDAELWDDPGQAAPAWQPAVADFVLGRRPWER
jgi:tRNA nucleotidyltransferase (CCA-adding enzyme)